MRNPLLQWKRFCRRKGIRFRLCLHYTGSFPQRREIGENHSRQAFRDIGKANFGAISVTERCCSAISHNGPPKNISGISVNYGNKVVGKPQTPGNPVVFLVFAAKPIPRNETLVDCISETAQSINTKFGTQAPFYKNFRRYENY